MPSAAARRVILCFGDSNTWGRDPHSTARHPEDGRWPFALQKELGEGWYVIPEGLNGRTTVWDDPIEEHRCGKAYLAPCLLSHQPIDLVVLMLGTNDLKKRFSVSPFDVGRSVGLLLDMILRSGAGPAGGSPQTLLICPPPVGKLTEFAEMFEGAPEKSRQLAPHYRAHAEQWGVRFLDAGGIVAASDGDGLHLDVEAHRKLGAAVAVVVREMIAPPEFVERRLVRPLRSRK